MIDDELLELLTAALAPELSEPPPASLALLHRAIDARNAFARKPLRVHHRWVVPAVAAFGVLGISGGALAATGTSLPRLARRLAYDVGLPVDSPQLYDARSHRDALRAALARHDITAIATESAKLRAELGHLNTDEHNRVGNDTDQLLQQADSQTDAKNVDDEQVTPTATSTARDAPLGDPTTDNQPANNQNSDDQTTNTTATTTGQVDVQPPDPLSPDEPSSTVTDNPQNPTTTTATSVPNVDIGQNGEP